MKTLLTSTLCLGLALTAGAQGDGSVKRDNTSPVQSQDNKNETAAERARREYEQMLRNRERATREAEDNGVEVRIKDVARFRGVRGNQLYGYGLVIGLDGSGDSRKTPFTTTLLQNAMKDFGTTFDERLFNPKNIAAVAVTAELPPFASPGNTVDITVTSIGDAKSLKGGFLLQTPLYPGANRQTAYIVGQGAVDVGGFSAGGGGNSVSKGHVTVGRIAGGGMVEASVPTSVVFDGMMYLELNEPDFTAAVRMAKAVNTKMEGMTARAVDGGTVEIRLPSSIPSVQAIAQIEKITFMSDTQALVVINPRTGTVVIGGNVRLGPATIIHGSIKVQIESVPVVSQPNEFSKGETVVTNQTTVTVDEPTAQAALLPPTATLADLTRILQELKVTPGDLMQILDALKRNGALKAKIVVQ